jgi:colanic acid biosynthesis glycosyl transferase WcaI
MVSGTPSRFAHPVHDGMTKGHDDANPRVFIVNRFFHPDHSATSQIASDLAFHLVSQGYRVTAIAGCHGYDGAHFASRETVSGVDIIRVGGTNFGRGSTLGRLMDLITVYPALLVAMVRHISKGDTLIAKTDPPLLSVVSALASRIKGARLFCWMQDLYPEVAAELGASALQGWLGAPLRFLRDWSLRKADRCVVIGERMAERIAQLGVPQSRITIIHNWCEDALIKPVSHADNPVRREWGFTDADLVVGYSGNLGRAHEYETILSAAEQLQDTPSIRFLMVGGGASAQKLKGEAAKRGITSFSFQPYQPREKLALSLGAADLHWLSLLPAMEGLIVPSKAYGIAAAGRPIIAITDQDGEVARLVKAHDAGVVVSPGDGEALATALMDYANDPSKRIRQGAAARHMLEKKFTMQASLERWISILKK